MIKNSNLYKAKKARNNEYYTMLDDVKGEMSYYAEQLKGKYIFCNCNDSFQSAFWIYFHTHYSKLGLKCVIATTYNPGSRGECHVYLGGNDSNIMECMVYALNGDGDFRSKESIDIAGKADILITNPPFSLLQEYLCQMDEEKCRFIVIGNKNAITYKKIFPMIADNRIWTGNSSVKQFVDPQGNIKTFGNIGWFTNVDGGVKKTYIPLTEKYHPDKYPKYDNYDAINVDRVKDIPIDYNGIMGVPISFMDRYNPEQFDLVAIGSAPKFITPSKIYKGVVRHNLDGTTTGKHICVNQCLVIAHKDKPDSIYFTAENSDRFLTTPYQRLLIRRKRRKK